MRPKPLYGLNALIVLAVVILLVTALCGSARAQDVDVLRTCQVAFECVDNLELANAIVSWKFSFNPRRAALYDIVHWTVTRPGERPTEFVAQIAVRRQGEREVRYYRVYEHVRRRNWKWLWLRRTIEWRELEWGSPHLNDANTALARMFGLAMALRHGADPASLTF